MPPPAAATAAPPPTATPTGVMVPVAARAPAAIRAAPAATTGNCTAWRVFRKSLVFFVEDMRSTGGLSPCVVVREETVGGSLQTIIEFIYACPPPLQLFLQGLSADFFSLYKQSFLSGSRVTTSAEGSSPSAGHSPARPVMWAMFDSVM